MFKLSRRTIWVMALGLGALAGCHHGGRPSTGLLNTPTQEGRAEINAAQVADVQIALGRTLEKRGDIDQAVAAYTDASKKDPNRVDSYVRLAILLDQQGKCDEAKEQYRKALALQPDNADLHCNCGYSLYLQRRWSEAEQHLRKALSLKADHARAHTNLGLVLARMGRTDEALQEFQRAGNNEVDARLNLAYVATSEGDWANARGHYELALKLNPSSKAGQEGLRNLETLQAKSLAQK